MAEQLPGPDGLSKLLPIPQVPTHFFGLAGNLPDVDPSFLAKSIWRLADLYGPIFQLDLLNRKMIVISSYELLRDVMDDDRFEKIVAGGLVQVRAIVKDGLFTAYGDEMVGQTDLRMCFAHGYYRIGLWHIEFLCLSLALSQFAACLTNSST